MSLSEHVGRRETPDPFAVVSGDRSLTERLLLLWDLAIIGLVTINLALIIFDTLFAIAPVGHAVGAVWPSAHDWYAQHVHRNFTAIDLAFVSVFVLDVLAGWVLAIVQQRYPRWYFYPFARWFDVLGCIPVAGFRFLRALRVISIVMRLQRLGVIDIRGGWLYRQLMVYYDIVVEEISDRVVLKVLTGVQDEMKSGGQQLSRRIVRDVIAPRRRPLTRAASAQLEYAIVAAYRGNRDQIQAYLGRIVGRAADANPALNNLERVPMLGRYVSEAIDDAIRDTVNQVLDEAVDGLSSEEFDALVGNLVEAAIERLLAQEVGAASSEIRDVTIEVLELVKEQVAVQRWRAHFE
ncbi:preprotein translocase subunit SecA [Salinisphaera sp. LB1]|uniref:preprotein translocase subunit SecA n=1 Tax=Salinisphaera sp. LB1 TaxID=2183911 RepID=UPI000D708432|nr:preprotein translocase subunit SecA [Salinisphaera sp. LB1]AWN15428.1 hypothetical protein SALB1_1221 [Salinisphaera sp. LB1]